MNTETYETILDEFSKSNFIQRLEIGEIVKYSYLSSFERMYSSQAVYKIEGKKGIKKVFIKIYKNFHNEQKEKFKATIKRDFKTNLFWYDYLAPIKGFTTFKPVYHSGHLHAIITEHFNGVNIGQLIYKKAKYFPSKKNIDFFSNGISKTGKLLKILQDKKVTDKKYNFNDIIDDVDIRLVKLKNNPYAKFSEKNRQAILNFYKRCVSEFPDEEHSMVHLHLDFTMGNIMLNTDEVALHDFGEIGVGHHYFDMTRFYHQLELLKYKPIYRPGVINKLQNTFLNSYGYTDGPNDLKFRFFLLRHFITHFVGVARLDILPIKQKMYNKWVILNHHKNIKKIINI